MPPKQELTKAPESALPAFITAGDEGREQIDPSDLSVPRLVVVNALSKQFKDQTAKLGDLVETVGGNVLGSDKAPVRGVFLAVRKMRNKWRARGQGEGIECHSSDGKLAIEKHGLVKGTPTNNCALCEYSQFTKMPDGSIKAPACTEYREFLFLSAAYPYPLVISMGKSGAKAGKKLVEKLNADMGLHNRPLYAFAYEVGSRHVIAKGNDWYEFEVKPAGFPDEELFGQAKTLYGQYKDALKKQDYRAQEREGAAEDMPEDKSGPAM